MQLFTPSSVLRNYTKEEVKAVFLFNHVVEGWHTHKKGAVLLLKRNDNFDCFVWEGLHFKELETELKRLSAVPFFSKIASL